MGTKTTNFGLAKPAPEDFYDIGDFNGNADVIDLELKKVNNRVDRGNGLKTLLLSATKWSGVIPYTQSVSVSGVTAADVPIVGISIAEGTAPDQVKVQNKAWGCVDRAVTGSGTITFYCYNKKPAIDFSVNVKGV